VNPTLLGDLGELQFHWGFPCRRSRAGALRLAAFSPDFDHIALEILEGAPAVTKDLIAFVMSDLDERVFLGRRLKIRSTSARARGRGLNVPRARPWPPFLRQEN